MVPLGDADFELSRREFERVPASKCEARNFFSLPTKETKLCHRLSLSPAKETAAGEAEATA